jgi:hypothetical protein
MDLPIATGSRLLLCCLLAISQTLTQVSDAALAALLPLQDRRIPLPQRQRLARSPAVAF